MGIFAFGTYMIPLKKYPHYSSWAFIAVMSLGALLCSSVIATVTGQFNLQPVGVACGLLWVVGGALCFWAVQAEADLAGAGLRSMSVSILLSFITGVTLFAEHTLLYFSIPAIVCMLVGIWIPAGKMQQRVHDAHALERVALLVNLCIGSIVLFLLITLKRGKRFDMPLVPSLFAFFAGSLWMLGTLAIFWAIADDGLFGYAVGYPLLQLNLVVNQLWGVFAFGEYATRRERIKLATSTVVILAGAVLLTLSKM